MAYNNNKKIVVFGATGSIGTDLIDIVSNNELELEDCGRVEVRTKHDAFHTIVGIVTNASQGCVI